MNLVEVVNATRTEIDEELVARLVATVLEAEGVPAPRSPWSSSARRASAP